MRTKYIVLASLLVLSFGMKAQSDAESAKSVVKIKTTHYTTENGKKVKKLGTGTGWCWKEPQLIVTALHAIAGADKISVYKNAGSFTTAKVERVLKEADLALLRIEKDLGLKPLSVEQASPNSNKEYYVWGFPHGVYSIQGDVIRFSRSLQAAPTLNSILTGNKLKFQLKKQGYPLPHAKILRIGSIIQPGHSGAPIFTSTGKVIGIADGGLRGGTARINWAIPSSEYVPQLIASKDQIPVSSSLQTNLYSKTVTVSATTSEKQEDRVIEQETRKNTVSNGKQSMEKTWTANFRQIYETLDQESKDEVDETLAELGGTIDLRDTWYDVYEDYATGATIAVPYGENLVIENGWYYVSNPSQTIHFYTLPFVSTDYQTAVGSIEQIVGNFTKMYDWQVDPESPDKNEYDEYAQTYLYEIERHAQVEGRKIMLYSETKVEGANILSLTILIDITNAEGNAAFIKEMLRYAMAGEVSAFNKH